jgi:hypothetical protein
MSLPISVRRSAILQHLSECHAQITGQAGGRIVTQANKANNIFEFTRCRTLPTNHHPKRRGVARNVKFTRRATRATASTQYQ